MIKSPTIHFLSFNNIASVEQNVQLESLAIINNEHHSYAKHVSRKNV